ncbi:MAG: ATP-grasp domain-containing protein [bacterium]
MNILLTGSGCPGWYATFKQLQEYRVFGCDIQDNTAGNYLATKHFVVTSGNSKSYLNMMKNIVEFYNIDVVVPLTDPELIPLSKSDLPVMVSETSELEKMLDKSKLYDTLPNISPNFIRTNNKDEVRNFMEDNSCFIKLITAYGSRGTKKLILTEDWLEGFATLKPEAFGLTFPLDYLDRIQEDIIAVETLPGDEYSIDCVFNKDGELHFLGARQRKLTRSGICHTALFVDKEEFREFVSEVQKHINMRWNINIQAKRDKNGDLKLLEINPRISGSLDSFAAPLAQLGVALFIGSPPPVCKSSHGYRYRVSHFIGK